MIVVSRTEFHVGLMLDRPVVEIKSDKTLNLLFDLISGYK
jgi:hypothetical protein